MSVNGHIVELEVMFSSTSKCRQMCSWGETLFYFIDHLLFEKRGRHELNRRRPESKSRWNGVELHNECEQFVGRESEKTNRRTFFSL